MSDPKDAHVEALLEAGLQKSARIAELLREERHGRQIWLPARLRQRAADAVERHTHAARAALDGNGVFGELEASAEELAEAERQVQQAAEATRIDAHSHRELHQTGRKFARGEPELAGGERKGKSGTKGDGMSEHSERMLASLQTIHDCTRAFVADLKATDARRQKIFDAIDAHRADVDGLDNLRDEAALKVFEKHSKAFAALRKELGI